MKIIPVSILTGFLGAGKTTLLNYILQQQHGYKFAVIVNELGAISIDHQLVETAGDEIVELSNGCLCCTIRKDLVRSLQRLLARGGFDYLLIETTGIAEPSPIIQTFLNVPALQQFARLDAVITVVDAENIVRQIKTAKATVEQIAVADFLLLNKVDLVPPAQAAETERALRQLNPHARIFRTDHAQVNLRELLDLHAFDLTARLANDPTLLDEFRQQHEHDIGSVAFAFVQPFDGGKFDQFLEKLSESETILRAKGIVWIAGQPTRGIFHGVCNRFTMFTDRAWRNRDEQRSQLVFIGRELDRDALQAELERCLA